MEIDCDYWLEPICEEPEKELTEDIDFEEGEFFYDND